MSDYTNIEGLVIEVEADASSASQELEWLTARIEQFKSAVTNSRSLTTFATNMDKLTLSLSNMSYFNDTISSFTSFATGVSMLSKVNVKAGIATNISKLAEATKMFSPESISQLGQVVNALSGLSAINGLKLSSTIPKYLETIAEATKKMDGVDFTKLRELTEALAPLAQVAVADGEGMRDLAASVKTFSSVANSGAKRGRTFNTVLANIRSKLLAMAYGVRTVARVITGGLRVYGDYIETLNLFSVSMGESAEQAFEYANKVQDALGIDLTQWMKSQGVFQTLAKGFGIATDRATIMSQQLTQLAYDISSFYNISVEDAVQKVQSAFSGELEPVRRLGFDLSQAKLQAIALSLGIDENVKSMDQAEKASLRYYALLTQVTDAQGDLARTLSSPTNQLRIFNAQITQLSRSLGQLFIPILNKVLPYLNAMVQVLKWIIDEIAALFGYTLPGIDFGGVGSGVADGVGEVGDALDDATGKAEKLKNTLASFDEINLIGSKSGGGSGSDDSIDLGSGFDFDLPQYDFLGEATENRAKTIAENIKKIIAPAVEKLKDAIIYIRDNWDAILTTTKVLIGLIASVKFVSWLSNVIKGLKEINTTALGVTMAIAGITLSFAGGEAMADGNYLKGFVETILGGALAAIGGFLVFGATGATIGLAISFAAMLIGFKIEQQKQFEQAVHDLYFSLEEGKKPLEDFVKEWTAFTDTYVEGFEKISGNSQAMAEAKDNIAMISTSVEALKQAYSTGEIDVAQFGEEMSALIKTLSENIQQYMRNAHEAITTELGGALGTFLIQAGYTTSEIEKIMNMTDSKIEAQITASQKNMESLKSMHESGLIDDNTFVVEMQKNVAQLQSYVSTTNDATKALEDFKTANKFGINFGDLDDVLNAIQTIKTNYDQAAQALDSESRTVLEGLRFYAQNADDEYKAYFEGVLASAQQYYAQQGDLLKTTYTEKLSEIESSAGMDFSKILGLKDPEATVEAYDKYFSQIHNAIAGALQAEDISWEGSEADKAFTFITNMVDSLRTYAGDDTWSHRFGKMFMDLGGDITNSAFGALFGFNPDEADSFIRNTHDNMNEYAKVYEQGTNLILTEVNGMSSDIEEALGIPFDMYGTQGIEDYIYAFKQKHPEMSAEADALREIILQGAAVDLSAEGTEAVESLTRSIYIGESDIRTAGGATGEWILSGYMASIDINAFDEETLKIITAISNTLGEDEGIITASSNIINTISGILSDPTNEIGTATSELGDKVYGTLDSKTPEITGVTASWLSGISDSFVGDNTVTKEVENWLDTVYGAMDKKSAVFKVTGDTIRNTIITAANAVGATSFTSFGGDIVSTIGDSITTNKNKLDAPAKGIVTGLVDYLNVGLSDIEKYGDDVVISVSEGITKGSKNSTLKSAVSNIGDTIYGDLVNSLSAMTDYGYNVGIKVAEGLENNGSTNRVASAARNMKNTVEDEFDDMSKDIEKTVNDLLKKLSNAFNNFKITGSFNTSTGNLNTANIPGYANGGFPNKADLFFANEDGVPEYIGSMGGKTAVANNTEIIKGVSEGVYRAIKETGIAEDVKYLKRKDNTTVFAPSKEAGKVMSTAVKMYNGQGGRYQ